MPKKSGRPVRSRSAPEKLPVAGRVLLSFGALSILFCLCAGCAVVPSAAEMDAVIRTHFEARHYQVTDLRVGGVTPIPLGEKTYMGREGYGVVVESITLEAEGSQIPGIRKGEKLTFTDASVTIRRKAGEPGGWTVSRISGIPVP